MGIQRPPMSKKAISELLRDHEMMEKARLELERRAKIERDGLEHKRLTEENKKEIKRMVDLYELPTSSYSSGTPGSGGTPGSFGTMSPSGIPGGKYDPYTMTPNGEPLPYTPKGHNPEMWKTGSIDVGGNFSTSGLPQNNKPKAEQQHVVPSEGKKHHIEVQDMSHKIAPRRKSMIESIFGFIKTKTVGPK